MLVLLASAPLVLACGREKAPEVVVGPAPDSFRVAFATSKGDVVVAIYKAWSPHGAERFYQLVSQGFFGMSQTGDSATAKETRGQVDALPPLGRRGARYGTIKNPRGESDKGRGGTFFYLMTGGGAGGSLSLCTQAERSKSMNSSAFSCGERSPVLHDAGNVGDCVFADADTWKSL